MTKNEFLEKLDKALSRLPYEDRKKSLDYYSEIIDDAVENGENEEEFIEKLGSVEEIRDKIAGDIPLKNMILDKLNNHTALILTIIILVITSFIWLPILIGIITTIISVYISIWAVILSGAVGTVALIIGAVIFAIAGNFTGGLFLVGLALIAVGVTALMFFFTVWATKKVFTLASNGVKTIKRKYFKKEGENV